MKYGRVIRHDPTFTIQLQRLISDIISPYYSALSHHLKLYWSA